MFLTELVACQKWSAVDPKPSKGKNPKMLVDGPSEWAETSIPAGNKLDLLQHAYNEHLGVAALPTDATVVLVRYSSNALGVTYTYDEVMEIAGDEVELHAPVAQDDGTKPDVFRFIAWSGTIVPLKKHRYAAVATVGRVEIWRVDVKESLHAVKIGAHEMPRIRGICWNPEEDTLLVYGDVDLTLIGATEDDHTYAHAVSVEPAFNCREMTKQCVWASSGSTLARSTEHNVYFLTWPTCFARPTTITKSSPSVSSFSFDTTSSSSLLGNESKMGSITAMAMLSKSECIIATDVPLVLDDMKLAASLLNASDSFSGGLLPSAAPAPVSNVIDLTSLRATVTARSSLLNILEQPSLMLPPNQLPQKRASHITIISNRGSDHWSRRAEIKINNLTTPDVLDIAALRIVVGSTISNRLVALHLEHSLTSGWSIGVSGELELPEGHVCRGLRVIQTSPFVQVASAERTRRTFFHASSGPQRIQLSKFKLPRRRESVVEEDSSDAVQTSPKSATTAPASSPTPSKDSSGVAAVLSQLAALQTLMVSRFDHLERRLDDVSGRLERLEVADRHSSSE